MHLQIAFILCLTACGSPSSTTRPEEEPLEPTSSPEPPAAPQFGSLSRSEAIQRGELFVRQQGYTEIAPAEGVTLQLESLDDPDQARELRRGTLLPRAVSASQAGAGWLVFFAYNGTDVNRATGRAVRVAADRSIEIVHQDAVLPESTGPLTVTAAFSGFLNETPHCGTLHVAGVAEYAVISVQSGSYNAEQILVVHGCPELPRPQYESNAGDVIEFREGDVHHLNLVVHVPEIRGGIAILDTAEHPEHHRYWAETTNQAPPQL